MNAALLGAVAAPAISILATFKSRLNAPQNSTYVSTWYGSANDPAATTQITVGALTPNAGIGLTLTLQLGFVISSTLTDPTTSPATTIANANVDADLPPPLGGCCPQGVGGTNTQSNGTFRFVVPAGTYILYVNAPQGSTYLSQWHGGTNDPATAKTITVGASAPNAGIGLALTLQLGFRTSGVVTDPATRRSPARMSTSTALRSAAVAATGRSRRATAPGPSWTCSPSTAKSCPLSGRAVHNDLRSYS